MSSPLSPMTILANAGACRDELVATRDQIGAMAHNAPLSYPPQLLAEHAFLKTATSTLPNAVKQIIIERSQLHLPPLSRQTVRPVSLPQVRSAKQHGSSFLPEKVESVKSAITHINNKIKAIDDAMDQATISQSGGAAQDRITPQLTHLQSLSDIPSTIASANQALSKAHELVAHVDLVRDIYNGVVD